MAYLSLVISMLVLFFVIRLTLKQKRFDVLNCLMVMFGLTSVLLDLDTILLDRLHPHAFVPSFGVLIAWSISHGRSVPDNKVSE